MAPSRTPRPPAKSLRSLELEEDRTQGPRLVARRYVPRVPPTSEPKPPRVARRRPNVKPARSWAAIRESWFDRLGRRASLRRTRFNRSPRTAPSPSPVGFEGRCCAWRRQRPPQPNHDESTTLTYTPRAMAWTGWRSSPARRPPGGQARPPTQRHDSFNPTTTWMGGGYATRPATAADTCASERGRTRLPRGGPW